MQDVLPRCFQLKLSVELVQVMFLLQMTIQQCWAGLFLLFPESAGLQDYKTAGEWYGCAALVAASSNN
jgi:hypothetical protein